MENKNFEMFDLMSNYTSKSDIYAANAIAKISAFIYQYRMKEKMTQASFAEMMGVTQSMVSKWESAEYNFTIENIAQISEKLNVTFEIEFMPESEYVQSGDSDEYIRPISNDKKSLNEHISIVAKYNQAAA